MNITKKNLKKLIIEMSREDIVSREFYTKKEFKVFDTVSNSGNISAKPKGLWYSCNEEWKEWVMFEMPNWWESYNFKYNIQVNLNSMLAIRTLDELLAFEKKYIGNPKSSYYGSSFKAIDWGLVANDYAGIEICPYQYQARFNHDWYYGWDIASGCIWDASAFISVNEVYPFK